jgi:hypothetical protein
MGTTEIHLHRTKPSRPWLRAKHLEAVGVVVSAMLKLTGAEVRPICAEGALTALSSRLCSQSPDLKCPASSPLSRWQPQPARAGMNCWLCGGPISDRAGPGADEEVRNQDQAAKNQAWVSEWMRWKTYNRYVERYDGYEAAPDYGCAALAAKLTGFKLV